MAGTEMSMNERRRGFRLTVATAACAALIAALFVVAPVHADALPNCPPTDPDYPDCLPLPPEPPDPSPTQPPLPPSIRITGRTDTTVTLDASAQAYTTSQTLQRSNGTGWIDLGGRSGSSYFVYSDTGLAPDSRYCYRNKATNSHGSSYSPSVCTYTTDGRFLPVWRIQLRIMTGDVSDAGTDDDVLASIGGPANGTGGSTYLDHARDDFERNDVHNYDVNASGIDGLGDIHSIVLSKFGDDDWCLRSVVLLVDNEVAFSTGFGNPCTWLGDDSPTTVVGVNHAALRAYPIWNSFRAPLPPVTDNPDGTQQMKLTFPAYELEQRIEGLVGNSIRGTDAYWGSLHGRGVEVAPVSSSRVAVDIDLAASATLTDPDVDVDFDLVTGSRRLLDGTWAVDLTMENLRVDVDLAWYLDLLDYLLPCDPIHAYETNQWKYCFAKLASDGEKSVKAQIGNVVKQLNLPGGPSKVASSFDGSGALVIDLTFGTPRPK